MQQLDNIWFPINTHIGINTETGSLLTMYGQFGLSEAQGSREEMEDKSVVMIRVKLLNPSFNNIDADSVATVISVFDGHGGSLVAELCAAILQKLIISDFERGNEVQSLKTIFRKLDRQIKTQNPNGKCGSCAVVIIIINGRLYCANVGDSEAILIKRDHSIINLTTIHRPKKGSSEEVRITDLGGHVVFERVLGQLAVSRAFGDHSYKKPALTHNLVLADPSVKVVNFDQECLRIIVACDGLWDVFTHQECADFVDPLVNRGKTAQECANALIRDAMDRWTQDNVSVSVVEFTDTPTDVSTQTVFIKPRVLNEKPGPKLTPRPGVIPEFNRPPDMNSTGHSCTYM